MCSKGVNTTKLYQFVGSYALYLWYFGMLVVTMVTTGKGRGDPSTSVMQWEYSSLLFQAVKSTLRLNFTACCPLRTRASSAETPHVHTYSKHTNTHFDVSAHSGKKMSQAGLDISYLLDFNCQRGNVNPHMRAHVQTSKLILPTYFMQRLTKACVW